jgi:hypothetical protein
MSTFDGELSFQDTTAPNICQPPGQTVEIYSSNPPKTMYPSEMHPNFSNPQSFLESLKYIYNYKTPSITKPIFIFDTSDEAASNNASILRESNFDLHHILTVGKYSPISYGFKFKPASILYSLLQYHPLWGFTESILTKGASFPLQSIPHDIRLNDNQYHLQCGNHKSATQNINAVSEIINKEIIRGFALPLPIDLIQEIPNGSIAPLGLQTPESINEFGDVVEKLRLTHDQTFPGPSGHSVNKRVIHNELPPNVYGFTIKRILNYIASLCLNNPNTKIFLSKFDFDAAYHRCHLSASTAYESMTIHNNRLILSLRLTFGGTPCPNLWNCLAEPITDIANRLILTPEWDHNTFYDPMSDSIAPPAAFLDESMPFGRAQPLIIDIPMNNIGKIDLYIDDNVTTSLGINDNHKRVSAAITLAIRSLTRPLDDHEPLQRKDIISLKKFLAESQPSEVKICLGWEINTRTFKVSLPKHKYKVWDNQLDILISSKRVHESKLEKMIGCLNHIAYLFDMLRHFLSRLREALQRSRNNSWTSLKIAEKQDLILMKQFIKKASLQGVSINNLTFRKPTHIYQSDASLHGLGGYNLIAGKAWRYEIPEHLRLKASLNSLEFIAALLTIWMDAYHNDIEEESCLLCLTDSTTATGWLKKSNFADKEEEAAQLTTARKLASLILDLNSCLYSQWFAREDNIVADFLSRDFHLSNEQLTFLITTFAPKQVPFGFKIYRLPQEIVLWLTCLMQNLPSKQQWSQLPKPSKLWLGNATSLTLSQSELRMIHSWKNSINSNESGFSEHSPKHFEKVDFIMENILPSSLTAVKPPLNAWHRPSGWKIDLTQELTSMDDLQYFYQDNSEDLKTLILPLNNK